MTMFEKLKYLFNGGPDFAADLKSLQTCDVSKDLPLLVIEDTKTYITKPKGSARPAIDFVMRNYLRYIRRYHTLLRQNNCNVVDISTPMEHEQCGNIELTVAMGIRFIHADGKEYLYWSWLHTDKKKKTFGAKVFDGLAREGLDSRTIDNYRVDYRAGRIYQHNLPLK